METLALVEEYFKNLDWLRNQDEDRQEKILDRQKELESLIKKRLQQHREEGLDEKEIDLIERYEYIENNGIHFQCMSHPSANNVLATLVQRITNLIRSRQYYPKEILQFFQEQYWGLFNNFREINEDEVKKEITWYLQPYIFKYNFGIPVEQFFFLPEKKKENKSTSKKKNKKKIL